MIDTRMTLGVGADEFGLGDVLWTLRDRSFAWWVRFDVDIAWRENARPGTSPISGWMFDLINIRPYDRSYQNFRFTQQGFNLDDYDEVWFFGYNPGDEPNTDASIRFADNTPLETAELRRLAEWMDRGGGVLGTGDHGLLGASLCSRVPRVRTMRRWTNAQSVPPDEWPDLRRHETLQPPTLDPYEAEGDIYGQPIELVYRRTGMYPAPTSVPHPLLCAPTGVIDTFPDHMHEGEVIGDADVDLDRPLNIRGYNGVEYPDPKPVFRSAIFGGELVEFGRPLPKVIAYGYTTHDPNNRKRFGLVGVYDGDAAGIGRVVVDSTWHHWLSMNLFGFRNDNPAVYRLMQAYFRNVALWLGRRRQRVEMLYAATWGVLAGSSPMGFQPASRRWRVGELALDAIGRTVSQCTIFELATAEIGPALKEAFLEPADHDPAEPWPSVLSMELFNRSVVGGIGTALLEPAFRYREARGRAHRHRLDGPEIARRAAAGAEDGLRTFVDVVGSMAATAVEVREGLDDGVRRFAPDRPSGLFEVTRMRVVAGRLRMSDPTDPVLLGGSLNLSLRVRVEESVVLSEALEIELPRFESHGAVVDLDVDLGEIDVQDGERLTVEVFEGEPGPDPAVATARFADTLTGDPVGWRGEHTPAEAGTWRLWYRIEAPATGE
ncbi:MAG TPA: hypothetical protein VLB67_16295 [Acidimicrobiia bacterium]|nr:hypothetical protein [Acidimicrobiia bacterium]